MNKYLTKWEYRIAYWLFKRIVRQGFHHDKRITQIYAMIRKAARLEFWEDNQATLDSFLAECYDNSINYPNG